MLNDPRSLHHYSAIFGDIFGHDTVCAYSAVIANYDRANQLGPSAYINIISYGGSTGWPIQSDRPNGDMLKNDNFFADPRQTGNKQPMWAVR